MTVTHLHLTERFRTEFGQFSILAGRDTTETWWLMERPWRHNRPHVSSVPRGEYTLEPFDGRKYKNTYGLVGASVSLFPDPDKPRYACVIHAAMSPSELEGCWGPCDALHANGRATDAVHARAATRRLLAFLDLAYDGVGSIKVCCQ